MKKCSMMVFVVGAFLVSAGAADNMKAFPSAEEGRTRHVIRLPEKADESAFKIELMVGKVVHTDKDNRYFFGGALKRETIKGWGFSKYTLAKLGPMAGTLMMPNPNAPKVDRFIAIGGEPNLIRYNSRLPVVVYTPEDVEVRYRIWSAGTVEAAEPK